MQKKRVTDYKINSRVVLPRAQSNEKESKLEGQRIEILEKHRKWTKENCDCKGEQEMNLSTTQVLGWKSLRKRIKAEEILVIVTDKSGRFAVMSWKT